MDTLHKIVAAVKSSDAEAVRALLAEDPVLANARDETGDSILLMSLYERQPEIREIILSHRPEVSVFEAAARGRRRSSSPGAPTRTRGRKAASPRCTPRPLPARTPW